jgi:hypothetical protein
MDGNSHVEVEREANPWRDRVRPYRIFLDGTEIGKVSRDSTSKYDISSGQHSIHLKLDWCLSPEISFSVQPGETASFSCGPNAASWRALYDATLGWKNYITLQQR